jgi:hypothetical protein
MFGSKRIADVFVLLDGNEFAGKGGEIRLGGLGLSQRKTPPCLKDRVQEGEPGRAKWSAQEILKRRATLQPEKVSPVDQGGKAPIFGTRFLDLAFEKARKVDIVAFARKGPHRSIEIEQITRTTKAAGAVEQIRDLPYGKASGMEKEKRQTGGLVGFHGYTAPFLLSPDDQ